MFEHLFGAETPLLIRFIIAGLVLLIAFIILMSPLRLLWAGRSDVKAGFSLKRGIIRIAELFILAVALLTILGSAILGAILNVSLARLGGASVSFEGAVVIGGFFGGIVGLLLAAITIAGFFVLTEIERNTRATALALQQITNRYDQQS